MPSIPAQPTPIESLKTINASSDSPATIMNELQEAKSAAKTYARKNLRFNCVAPGLVDTPLSSRITSNPIALKSSQKMHALGRIGKPSHISNMIKFLIKSENDWITGQNFVVDGGLSSTK